MARQLGASALFAGLAAGALAFLLQYFLINPLTFEAELFETGQRVHFQSSLTAPVESPAGLALEGAGASQSLGSLVQDAGFSVIAYTAYALLLVALMGFAQRAGVAISPRQGAIWGMAGFLSFQLAPAFGLPPEPPGVIAAEVGLRQTWMLGCVIATAAGLAMLAFGRGALAIVIGAVLIAAPHIWGAPHLDTYFGIVPPELAARYATHSLGVAAVGWTVLGWVAATVMNRMEPA